MISILSTTLVWDRLKEKGRWLWCTCSLLLTIAATGLIGRGRISGRTPMFVALCATTAGMSSVWSIVGTEFVQVWGGTRAGCVFVSGQNLTTVVHVLIARLLAPGSIVLWSVSRTAVLTRIHAMRSTLTSWMDAPGYVLTTYELSAQLTDDACDRTHID